MRLWMIEPLKVFETLEHRDRLVCDGRRIDREFLYAYRWMAEQMRKRLGPPPRGVSYPLWAWARCGGVDQSKPDLRSWRHYIGSGKFVRLEIEIPTSRILLCDYDAWHAVLTDRYLSWSESEEDAFDRGNDQRSEKARHALIEGSWNRIFDLEGGDPFWRGQPKERAIQATFWSLERTDVVDLRLFEGAQN